MTRVCGCSSINKWHASPFACIRGVGQRTRRFVCVLFQSYSNSKGLLGVILGPSWNANCAQTSKASTRPPTPFPRGPCRGSCPTTPLSLHWPLAREIPRASAHPIADCRWPSKIERPSRRGLRCRGNPGRGGVRCEVKMAEETCDAGGAMRFAVGAVHATMTPTPSTTRLPPKTHHPRGQGSCTHHPPMYAPCQSLPSCRRPSQPSRPLSALSFCTQSTPCRRRSTPCTSPARTCRGMLSRRGLCR